MIERLHPGYDIFKGLDGWYYPALLEGGAASDKTDSKGRHLDLGESYEFNGHRNLHAFRCDDNDVVSFDNESHAINFLNKWVRDEVGLGHALDVWETYNTQKAPPLDGEPLDGREQISFMGHYLVEAGTIMELWARGKVGDQEAVQKLHALGDEAVRDHLYTTADLLYKNASKIARKVA